MTQRPNRAALWPRCASSSCSNRATASERQREEEISVHDCKRRMIEYLIPIHVDVNAGCVAVVGALCGDRGAEHRQLRISLAVAAVVTSDALCHVWRMVDWIIDDSVLDDDDDQSYFEIRIQVDGITKDVSLMVTDFSENDEVEETKMLWDNQISDLKKVLGSS